MKLLIWEMLRQGVSATKTDDQVMEIAKTTTKSGSLSTWQDADASGSLKIDIARVKPDGAAVFAGSAAPNTEIRVFEGQILLGQTVSNSAGEWVIILEKSLAVGQHLISIAMERDDGSTAFADLSLAVEIYRTLPPNLWSPCYQRRQQKCLF